MIQSNEYSALFRFVLPFFCILIVERLRNEAKRERNVKCDYCQTAGQKYSAFPVLYLILLFPVFSLPYFRITDFFHTLDCCNIFPQAFLNLYSLLPGFNLSIPPPPPTHTPPTHPPALPIPPKRVTMYTSIRFIVCKKTKSYKKKVLSANCM